MPGGHFAVRTPHSCTIGLFGIAKFETQMLSLPSTFADQGPGSPPPVEGEPGYSVPSGRNTVMLPPFAPPVCFAISLVKASSALPPLFATLPISSIDCGRSPCRAAQAVRHPHVALTVDPETAAA